MKWTCDKCNEKYKHLPSEELRICDFCRLFLCGKCNNVLTVINMYVSFVKEKHTECDKQIDLV